MTRFKAAAVGTLAIVLAASPMTPALANGNGQHYGHGHHYWNPLYPIVGLAAAVVGTAAAIVTLPFQIVGAAAAQASYYAPPQGNYAPPQGYGAPGYAAPQAYYPAPAVSYAPPAASYYFVLLFRATDFHRLRAAAIQSLLAVCAYGLLYVLAASSLSEVHVSASRAGSSTSAGRCSVTSP